MKHQTPGVPCCCCCWLLAAGCWLLAAAAAAALGATCDELLPFIVEGSPPFEGAASLPVFAPKLKKTFHALTLRARKP